MVTLMWCACNCYSAAPIWGMTERRDYNGGFIGYYWWSGSGCVLLPSWNSGHRPPRPAAKTNIPTFRPVPPFQNNPFFPLHLLMLSGNCEVEGFRCNFLGFDRLQLRKHVWAVSRGAEEDWMSGVRPYPGAGSWPQTCYEWAVSNLHI